MSADYDYAKKVLQQIWDSYQTIQNLQDQPGDLDILKKELLKINGFFNVMAKKLEPNNFQSKNLLELKPKIQNFLNNYYFVQEIDTMSPLYSNDKDRLKNMRLKIMEALGDKRLIRKIEELLQEL